LDGNAELATFCQVLEHAVIRSVEQGFMTKDLALCVSGGKEVTKEFYMYTEDYIEKVAEILA
jgi:isocitrate dehydrogenase